MVTDMKISLYHPQEWDRGMDGKNGFHLMLKKLEIQVGCLLVSGRFQQNM